jgi:Txe/YoeB family toxin of Txe-Axe toxin-antitoxin module
MDDVTFHARAFKEYMEWQAEDRKTLKKINELRANPKTRLVLGLASEKAV